MCLGEVPSSGLLWGFFILSYISRTDSFLGGSQEAESSFVPLFFPSYISRTNSFPGG